MFGCDFDLQAHATLSPRAVLITLHFTFTERIKDCKYEYFILLFSFSDHNF